MNRIYLKILLIFYLLFVFMMVTSGLSQEIMAVNTDIRIGFSEYGISGRWVPVTIIIENSEKLIDGNLAFYVINEDGHVNSATYNFKVVLPPGSKKIYRGVIPLNQDRLITVFPDRNSNKRIIKSKIVVELTEEDKLIKKDMIELNDFLFDNSGLLVVKDRGTGFTFLKSLAGIEEVIYEKTRFLPVNWLAYTDIKTLIFDNTELDNLNQNQIKAVEKWVSLGGNLMINGDELDKMLNSRLLIELFPCQLRNKKRVNLTSSSLYGDYIEYLPEVNKVEVQEITAASASTVITADNIPILFKRTYGQGEITVLTFDIKQFNGNQWSNRQIFMEKLIPDEVNIFHDSLFVEIDNNLLSDLTNNMLASLNFETSSQWLILILFIVFTGLIYGIYTLSFNKYHILKQIILISGLTVITTVICFILFGQPINRNENILGEMAIIDKFDNYNKALIEGYHVIFSAHGNYLKPAISIDNGLITGINKKNTVFNESKTRINIDSEKYSYLFTGESTWSADFFQSYYLTDFPLVLTANKSKDYIKLIIDNKTNQEISKIFLKSDKGWYQVDSSLIKDNIDSDKITYQFFYNDNKWQQDPPWKQESQEFQIYNREKDLERQVLDIIFKRKVKMQPEYWQNQDLVILILEGQGFSESVNIKTGRRNFKGFIILPVDYNI